MAKGQHGRREPVVFDLHGHRVEVTWKKKRWRGRILGPGNREILIAEMPCKCSLLGYLRIMATMAASGSDGHAAVSRDDLALGGWRGI
jgi:hypothetical protein